MFLRYCISISTVYVFDIEVLFRYIPFTFLIFFMIDLVLDNKIQINKGMLFTER